MLLLYNVLLFLFIPLLVPYAFFKGLPYGAGLRNVVERSGLFSVSLVNRFRKQRVFWLHAVSVGEVRTALPLIRALKEQYSDATIVVTCVTFTGNKVAREQKEIDLALFFPYDQQWVVQRFVTKIMPDAVIVVETEIWPNFIKTVSQAKIPLILVNGRISDRSFPRYLGLAKVFHASLESISVFCMQSAKDERRIRRLGAPPGRISITGNMKFDMVLPDTIVPGNESLKGLDFNSDQQKVIVAGSTHEGEEETVVQVYKRLVAEHPDLRLVLIPRHPERSRQICDELAKLDVSTVLWTTVPESKLSLSENQVLVVDTVGEVLKFYSIADVVFVGGSLAAVGGHNILEASLSKKAVLFGPHMNNFKEIVKLVKEAYGGIQVKDADGLYHYLNLLLNNPDEAERLGENGFRLISENRGATERTLNEIARRV